MEDQIDLKQEYRNHLKTNDDEKMYIIKMHEIGKLTIEISFVNDMFSEGEIDIYEALTRVKILLELMGEVKDEIAKSI